MRSLLFKMWLETDLSLFTPFRLWEAGARKLGGSLLLSFPSGDSVLHTNVLFCTSCFPLAANLTIVRFGEADLPQGAGRWVYKKTMLKD